MSVGQAPAGQDAQGTYCACQLLEHGDTEGAVVALVAKELCLELSCRRGEDGKQQGTRAHQSELAGRRA